MGRWEHTSSSHVPTFPRSEPEPLLFGGRAYSPGGAPQAIGLANLELAGNYQGVDFYVLRSDREPPDALYVPVFEGYWLPFTPQH